MGTVTREALLSRATTTLVLPAWSEEAGKPQTVRIRRLTAGEVRTLHPPPAPGQEEWPPDERVQRLRDWRASLPEAERRRLDRVWLDVDFQVIALSVMEPKVSAEEARAFGPDADWLIAEILRFSGFIPTEKTSDDAHAAAAAGATA